MNILFTSKSEDSRAHYLVIQVPPIMLTIEPRMVIIY